MLEYQKQDCDLTLQEGLECYYKSFPESTEVFEDNNETGTLMRDHDCTHIIFGLDVSIEQEAILDSWVFWGSKLKLSYILGYQSLHQIKNSGWLKANLTKISVCGSLSIPIFFNSEELILSNFSDEFNKALEGIHPILRQVPPRVALFSITATFIPNCAALIAAT